MDKVLDKLTNYTLSLTDALANTNEANERPLLTSHLAAAAEMYALLHKHQNIESIKDIVKTEIRSHGWSFISGQAGEKIANNWVEFTSEAGLEAQTHNKSFKL